MQLLLFQQTLRASNKNTVFYYYYLFIGFLKKTVFKCHQVNSIGLPVSGYLSRYNICRVGIELSNLRIFPASNIAISIKPFNWSFTEF